MHGLLCFWLDSQSLSAVTEQGLSSWCSCFALKEQKLLSVNALSDSKIPKMVSRIARRILVLLRNALAYNTLNFILCAPENKNQNQELSLQDF